MKVGCSIGIFLNLANRICRSVSEGPFDFEITRVNCISKASAVSKPQSQWPSEVRGNEKFNSSMSLEVWLLSVVFP